MQKALFRAIVAAPLAMISTVALAGNPVDNYGAKSLSAGQYAHAITIIERQMQVDRANESLLLNLAMAYRHVGRDEDAARLYQRVLRLDDAELDSVGGRSVSAHRVAAEALGPRVQLSSR